MLTMKGFTTLSIHGKPVKKDVHGSLRMPIYDSVAFEHETSKNIALAFEGKKPAHSYSRITNPTVEDFEQRMTLISGGLGTVAVASGMAAISNTILTIAESGSNIISSKSLFGNTYSLFEKTLKPWGLEVKYLKDLNDIPLLEKLIDNKTRAFFLEIITNPQLEIPDIKRISKIARKHNILLIVDTTLTTPYIFKSKDFGVNIEILSSTKYISGGATSVGGVIIDNGNFDWQLCPRLIETAQITGEFAFIAKLRREVYRNLGACMTPHNAYLQTSGLETLALRIDKSCLNASLAAKYLKTISKAKSVNYPGLKDSRYFDIARAQFGDKSGSLLTFDLESKDACFAFMDKLKLIKRATNLQDNKTLIIHPASTIFCEYSTEEKQEMKVKDTMLRLSVGIEDVEDILDDIHQALQEVT
jgi:O-acetylhomoserine (thiol)-lyase